MEKFCELIKGTTPVFVMFYATWCPHCRRMQPIVDQLEGLENLIVLRYDIDDPQNKRLIDYYQVQAVPLMMIYSEGQQVWKWNGEIEKEKLMDTVRRLIGH